VHCKYIPIYIQQDATYAKFLQNHFHRPYVNWPRTHYTLRDKMQSWYNKVITAHSNVCECFRSTQFITTQYYGTVTILLECVRVFQKHTVHHNTVLRYCHYSTGMPWLQVYSHFAVSSSLATAVTVWSTDRWMGHTTAWNVVMEQSTQRTRLFSHCQLYARSTTNEH
jgi:hypothetical protein